MFVSQVSYDEMGFFVWDERQQREWKELSLVQQITGTI